MKLMNKKTGEIGYLIVGKGTDCHITNDEWEDCGIYSSLAELNAEWEDYEEPKEWWFIDCTGLVKKGYGLLCEQSRKECQEIGNYFETKEEAEKAVEKLMAWKRLKDKGFRFNGVTPMEYFIRFTYDKPRQILDNQEHPEEAQQFNKDIRLLFGGEE
jgi:hypothetical protein